MWRHWCGTARRGFGQKTKGGPLWRLMPLEASPIRVNDASGMSWQMNFEGF